MTYKGHVKSGQIVLDEPVSLPEGAAVNIEGVRVSGSGSSEDLAACSYDMPAKAATCPLIWRQITITTHAGIPKG